ncbi:MAG: protease inhibitor I42 family protein, partial [Chloroflexota bacterium]
PQPHQVVISYGDLVEEIDATRQLQMTTGNSVNVLLFSNPESGFEWEEPEISNKSVLGVVGKTSRSQDDIPATPPLTPRQDIWTFEARSEGSSAVMIAYSQFREDGRKGVWTVTLHITTEAEPFASLYTRRNQAISHTVFSPGAMMSTSNDRGATVLRQSPSVGFTAPDICAPASYGGTGQIVLSPCNTING